MEQMRHIAYATVLRACSFASLGIFCVMTGMSFDPALAFQTGGFFTMLMAIILIFKAREALTKDYRRTELWLNLDKSARPPTEYAQWASSTVLRDTYLVFAKSTASVSIVMWSLAAMMSFLGVEPSYKLDRNATTTQKAPAELAAPGTRAEHADKPSPAIRYQVFP